MNQLFMDKERLFAELYRSDTGMWPTMAQWQRRTKLPLERFEAAFEQLCAREADISYAIGSKTFIRGGVFLDPDIIPIGIFKCYIEDPDRAMSIHRRCVHDIRSHRTANSPDSES